MDLLEKYLPEREYISENKMYKSFTRRIQNAKNSKEVRKVLSDIKKAIDTNGLKEKEALKLVDMADEKLEKLE
jgi:hypothetical protein